LCPFFCQVLSHRKSVAPFCDFTNRSRLDGKNHTTVTDLNHINFIDLFYSFIFYQWLIKICRLFPNYTVNYQNPYFTHLLQETLSFFWAGCLLKENIFSEIVGKTLGLFFVSTLIIQVFLSNYNLSVIQPSSPDRKNDPPFWP